MYWVLFLLMPLLTRSLGQTNPCSGMTIADCRVDEDNILAHYAVGASKCQLLCQNSDLCNFWRSTETPGKECLHLFTNYHKDCRSFAGPTGASIPECMNVDLSTCGSIIGEECSYSGQRIEEFEPPIGDISSITACQDWAQIFLDDGVSHFHYLGVSEECRLYTSLVSSCSVTGGPAEAPPVEECKEPEWKVIQKRGQYGNPADYFSTKLWNDYKYGFGDPEKELWLGLNTIANLTSEGVWELRVELTDFQGKLYVASYTKFKVEWEGPFRLQVAGFDTAQSNVRDSLSELNGMAFSTSDNDHDTSSENCAALYLGAWWYTKCHASNLNGYNYNRGDLPHIGEFYAKGIIWNNVENVPEQNYYFSWPAVTMMIRQTA